VDPFDLPPTKAALPELNKPQTKSQYIRRRYGWLLNKENGGDFDDAFDKQCMQKSNLNYCIEDRKHDVRVDGFWHPAKYRKWIEKREADKAEGPGGAVLKQDKKSGEKVLDDNAFDNTVFKAEGQLLKAQMVGVNRTGLYGMRAEKK